jgi:hypothetical protein
MKLTKETETVCNSGRGNNESITHQTFKRNNVLMQKKSKLNRKKARHKATSLINQ